MMTLYFSKHIKKVFYIGNIYIAVYITFYRLVSLYISDRVGAYSRGAYFQNTENRTRAY